MADRLVGLDIGTSSIRAVEVTVGEGPRPILEAFGQVGLPPGAVVNGEIHEREEVAKAIRHLWHDGGFTEHRVHLGIAGLRAITREMDMPPVNEDELDSAVLFEAESVLPFPVEQTAVSAQVVAQYNDAEGNPAIRVLVAAAHRDLIEAAVAVVREAGLEPVGIDLNSAALARALFDPNYAAVPEAIVSVGASLSMVVVHQAGQLQFVRTIDLGGHSVTEAIGGTLGLPLPDAEKIKRSLAFPGQHDHQTIAAAQKSIQELVAEIHNSIRFYSSLPGRGTPSRLLVTGAGARAVGFLPALQQGLEIPVVPASPLSRIDSRLEISPEEAAAIDPTLAVPVGLALPSSGGKSFNLLPKEISAEYSKRRIRRQLLIAGLVILAIIILVSGWKYYTYTSKEGRVTTLTAQLTKIKTVTIPKYSKVLAVRKSLTIREHRLQNLVSTEVDWLVVFNQLGQYMPTTVATTANAAGREESWLTQLSVNSLRVPMSTGKTTRVPSTTKTAISNIGNGTVQVRALNYTDVLTFGETLNKSAALEMYPPTYIVINAATDSFQTTFTVRAAAGTHRLKTFPLVTP